VTEANPRVRTLPGARWSCRSCGHCCRSFDLGPVEPATLDALRAADPGSFWPPAAEQPWYELRDMPDGAPMAWLSRRGGACIFLDEQQRCAIHARLGEAAKPAFCREFPFHLVQERQGHSAIARPTCTGLHRSRVDGQPLEEQVSALLDLPRAYPVATFAPDRVEILPGLGLDLDGWYGAEPAILRLLEAPDEDPRETVAQLRDALARATGRALPTPDPQRYEQAMDVTIGLLAAALQPLVVPSSDDPREALPAQALGWLERASATPPAPLTPGAQAHLNAVLRAQVFGRLFHRSGGLPRAAGLFLVEVRMARCAAAQSDGGALDAAAVAGVLAPWWNLAGHGAVVHSLRLAAPTLEQIFTNA
jgi:Fe-S-cluster containining protein